MGSGLSKQAKNGANGTKDGKRSPNQEKHASADSTTPLAANAAKLDFPQTPIVDKHGSFSEKSLGRSRANTMSEDSITTCPLKVHELEGHSDVSRPPPPPRLRRLSELIDPAGLPTDSRVRSPSGHLFAPEQFLVHPDRPRSIRERQEDIREKVRAASRLGVQSETADEQPEEKVKEKKGRKKRACCSCFRC
ncbi:hypothetical protein LTR85_009440 [Meristemomyces frigidus]|nr:hypothetical protein LTR85_009440 [Meristemomyces frigidus]